MPSNIKRILIFLIFTATACGAVAQSFYQDKVNLVFENQPLEEVLWSLSDHIGFPISYSDKDLEQKSITVTLENVSISRSLDLILEGTHNYYEYIDGQIFILRNQTNDLILNGYIEDAFSGERLINASIYNLPSYSGTETNNFGFFSLGSKVGDSIAVISYIGYEDFKIDLDQVSEQSFVIKLLPANDLPAITISADNKVKLKELSSKVNENVLEKLNIECLSSVGGEVDILRLLDQLPGTTTGTDGLGGLHVRGGNSDQNLIMLDGVQIYNPYHSFGLVSIFDNNTMSSVKYLKGSFPARFGGRLSSVLDVRLKDGNDQQYKLSASTGLISSKLFLEGPIIKDKLSLMINARRTHFDRLFNNESIIEKFIGEGGGELGYFFGDMVTKLTYTPTVHDRLYFSYYNGRDKYNKSVFYTEEENEETGSVADSEKLDWGNRLAVVRWNHQYTKKLFSNFTLTSSKFDFNSEDRNSDNLFGFEDGVFGVVDTFNQEFVFQSEINKTSARFDFDYIPNSKHYIKTGLTYSSSKFEPGVSTSQNSYLNPVTSVAPISLRTKEWNYFIEDDWSILNNLKVNIGVFTSSFKVNRTSYTSFEPRFALDWAATKRLSFHGSANKLNQYVHVLTRSGSGFPTDLWVPSTDEVKPQTAVVFDLEASFQIDKYTNVSIGAFSKEMNNIIAYKERVQFLDVIFDEGGTQLKSDNWEENVTSGAGQARGLEFLLNRQTRKFSGLISYSLSESNRTFDELNDGKTYPFRFEHRHKIHANTSYQFSRRLRLGASWSYNSGTLSNVTLNRWQYIRQDGTLDFFFSDLGEVNSLQLPNYHRLDLSMSYKKKVNWGEWKLNLGVYNVYNRKNLFYIKSVQSYLSEEIEFKGVSIIPVLPYFAVQVSIF